MDVKNRFNHALARLDAREALPHVSPLKKKWVPAMAVGLAGTLIWNNQRYAGTSAKKQKALVRDVLVISGTTAGLFLGWRFTASKLAKKMADVLARLIGEKHVHAKRDLVGRLSNLFKPQLCDHGAEGFVKLESLAAGAILGGAGAGIVADVINREKLKETAGVKLKEGIFQFVGNVTFCTIAILAFSKAGKKLGHALAQTEIFKNLSRKALARDVARLTEKKTGDLALMPTSITGAVEKTMLAIEKKTAEELKPAEKLQKLKGLLAHELPNVEDAKRVAFVESLENAVTAKNFKEVHHEVRQFVAQAIQDDVKVLSHLGSKTNEHTGALGEQFEELALVKAENRGQLMGVLAGVVAGVMGGAWTSNQVNSALTKQFGLPQGHKVSLFTPPPVSWKASKLGDRGIHWWDAILHIDDWPSALYLAGVHSLESVIGILYGISGYLTGVAGTDYSTAYTPLKHPELYQNRAPIQRQQNAYQFFQKT